MSKAVFHHLPAYLQLLVLLMLIPVSTFVITLVGMLLLLPFEGAQFWEAWMQGHLSIAQLKYLQFLQSIGIFIVPSLIAARLFNSSTGSWMAFHRPTRVGLGLSLALLLAAQPLVAWLAGDALQPSLPERLQGLNDWMHQSEAAVNQLLFQFLDTRAVGPLIFNLLLMTILPALGEEMLFRGCLQPMLQRLIKNPHTAVWLTAFLFSAMHMQFLTFLPRLLLGALLGYLLLYGKSLWYPIVGHFANNLLALLLFHYYRYSNPEANPLTMEHSSPALWLVGLSLVLSVAILGIFIRYKVQNQLSSDGSPSSSFSEGR